VVSIFESGTSSLKRHNSTVSLYIYGHKQLAHMRYIPLVVHLVSILLWIPGIFMYPIVSFAFSLGGGGGFFSSMLGMSEKVELSVWESIKELAALEQWTVVFLISFFSLGIPFLKAGLLFYVQLKPNGAKTGSIRKGVASVSKWAMADVFAVLMTKFLTQRC
jgi:hypothetical protein